VAKCSQEESGSFESVLAALRRFASPDEIGFESSVCPRINVSSGASNEMIGSRPFVPIEGKYKRSDNEEVVKDDIFKVIFNVGDIIQTTQERRF
jgi:hypothetical protein